MSLRLSALAELVRLPAVLTVPGDALVGAATRGPLRRHALAAPLASVCLYWSGMALNDYADRELDALERPERPIPSGRVRPAEALVLAAGLTAAGVGIAALAGGAPAAGTAALLAATVWSYDLLLKDGPAGPAAMAAARGLDVLLGARGDVRRAGLPATVIAAHIAGVTVLSRGEVHGARSGTALGVTAGTAVTAAVAGTRAGTRTKGAVLPAALAGIYAVTVGRAQAAAASDPSAATVRRATGAGIRGLIPLQASLLARYGAPRAALGLLAVGPLARAASKLVSPT